MLLWFERDDVDILKVIELYESGVGVVAIKKQLNIPADPKTIYKYLKAAGIQMRKRYEYVELNCIGCDEKFMPISFNQKLCRVCAPDRSWTTRFYNYGITKPMFDVQLARQNSLCDLCGKPLPESFTAMRFDHNHDTGQIRGILHNKCNIGLHYVENENFVSQAMAYLNKWGESDRI